MKKVKPAKNVTPVKEVRSREEVRSVKEMRVGEEERSGATRRAVMQMKDLLLEVRAELDEQLRPLGVTSAQMKVLREIEAKGRLTGASAARLCHVTPQTLQAQMVRLETMGMVRRSADPENERLVLWSLSPAGSRLMRRGCAM